MPLPSWALVVVVSALLVGCTQHSIRAVSQSSSGTETPTELSQRDIGARVLASIDDARRAMGLGDPIAASNDVSEALSSAREAIDQFVPLPITGSAGSLAADHAASLTKLLGSFPVRVRLVAAQTFLTKGDIPDADAILRALQNRVPPRLIPQNMPLLEAAASLERAKLAAGFGTPQLRTQLSCAEAALHSYQGPARLAKVRALASTLDRALANPKQLHILLPDQVSIWQDAVAQWTKSERSDA